MNVITREEFNEHLEEDRIAHERIAILEHSTQIMEEGITKISNTIVGNGKEGVLVRLDRVEQIMKLIKWLVGVGGAVFVMDFAKIIYDIMTKRPL